MLFSRIMTVLLCFYLIGASAMDVMVANYADNTLSVIGRDESRNVCVALGPREVVVSLDKIFVLECESKSVGIYSLKDLSRVGGISLSDEPRALTVTPCGIFAVLKNQNRLISLDVKEFSCSELGQTSDGPRSMFFEPNLSQLFVTCNAGNCVDIFSVGDGDKIGSIETASNPYAVCLTNDTIIVTSIGQNCVQAFSRKDHTLSWVTNDIKHPTAIRMLSDGKLIVTSFDDHQIVALDVQTGKILKRIDTRQEPFGLDVCEGLIAISSHKEGYIQVFDILWGLVQEIQVGKNPHGITYFTPLTEETFS